MLVPMRGVLLPILLLAACSEPPAVSAVNARLPADARDTTAPPLVPLEPLLAAVDARGTAQPVGDLEGRVSRLEARAAALRGTVIDPDDRDRLNR